MIKRNPLPNEHAARQKPPELFKTFRRSKSFRNKPLPTGISIIYGIRKEKGPRGGSTEIQSFRFDKNKWGVREAKKWLKDNGFGTKIEKAAKRRKNPYDSIDEVIYLLENHKFVKSFNLIGRGKEGPVYYFKLIQRSFILNDIFLDKGEYAIKILTGRHKYNKEVIDQLKLMSNYGVIPKIYYIDHNSIIMKYINGITLRDFKLRYPNYSLTEINKRVEELEKIWWDVGKFVHMDICDRNILITENMKVYLIDPM